MSFWDTFNIEMIKKTMKFSEYDGLFSRTTLLKDIAQEFRIQSKEDSKSQKAQIVVIHQKIKNDVGTS